LKPIAVCSVVTDPEAGEETEPFVTAFFDGKTHAQWWGHGCQSDLARYIESQSGKMIVYARNGGRADFYHLLPWIDRRELMVIDSRIVRCWIGPHQLRDSWAITPFDLYKDPVDYSDYHKDMREGKRAEIQASLCVTLNDEFKLCKRFVEEFGEYSTLGAVSSRVLSHHVPYWRGTEAYDESMRKRFYFGGRNELFRSGVIEGDIREYDVSSMYGSVMCDYLHPVGTKFSIGKRIGPKTCFVVVKGENHGAFCIRSRDTGELVFGTQQGEYAVSIHEFNAGVESGSFRVRKVIEAYNWERLGEFSGFVRPYYDKRITCSRSGDYWGTEIYKNLINAAYGKFSQNPSRYCDYYLTDRGCKPARKGEWVIAVRSRAGCGYTLWKQPARHMVWMNVATAASITGAARARLLEGMQKTKGWIYCDTDSLICDGPTKIEVGKGEMGKWKLEHRATTAAMVRKKIYALFGKKGECLKIAHSGCSLTPDEVLRAAQGERLEKVDLAPTFSLSGGVEFRKYTVSRMKG
jgi:hypothetical protein